MSESPPAANAAESRDPASLLTPAVDPILIVDVKKDVVLNPSAYDLPIDLYRSGSQSADESTDVVFFFGPVAKTVDFENVLVQARFRGMLVVFKDDPDGSHADKFFGKTEGFDAFCHDLFNKISGDKTDLFVNWPSSVKHVVLVGYDTGGKNLNQLVVQSSDYLKLTGALGLFDAKLPTDFSGLAKFVAKADTGFQMYSVHSSAPDYSAGIAALSQKLEQQGSVVEHTDDIMSDDMTNESILTTCLPKFLAALSVDPFISFHCKK